MDWILDHIQLIIIIGSSIAWWLTQQKQENTGDEKKPSPHDRPGRQRIDWERQQQSEQAQESDAARQVRERMRRLREQRGQRRASPPAQPQRPQPRAEDDIPPMLRELMGMPEREPEPEPTPPLLSPPPVPRDNRAQRMAQEMRELEAKQREAEAMAQKVRGQIGGSSLQRRRKKSRRVTHGRGDALSDQAFLETLRDPRSARRAILLKEILDRPVGLR